MSDKAYFNTIKSCVQSKIKIKRSVFICALSPVKTPEEAKAVISRISKANKNATHNCWAWIVGENATDFHSSDAGEPAGTAGKPMLNALHHHRLTDVAAVVTRHYGGVKLGVRGLIDAYFNCVENAVKQAGVVKNISTCPYRIQLAYAHNDAVLNQLDALDIQVVRTAYSEKITHDIEVVASRKDDADQMLEAFQARGWLRIVPL